MASRSNGGDQTMKTIRTQEEFKILPPGHHTISKSLALELINLQWRKSMLNRQLTKVINLHKEGVSIEVCIAIIMDLTKTSTSLEIASWIHKFYAEITKKEN